MNGYRGVRRLSVLLLAGALAACGQPAAPPYAKAPQGASADRWAASIERVRSAGDADIDGTVAGLWAFADRFGQLQPEGENTVYSPASIGYAFGMLRAAAGGATARQLDEVFGFPNTLHDAFDTMRRDIMTVGGPPPKSEPRKSPDDRPEPPIVSLVNALFLQDGYQPDQQYQQLLRDRYGAAAQHVDFTSSQAKEIIDAWVKKQTAGRIDKLFDVIPPSTVAVLANAVYLKADWVQPFSKGLTSDATFHRADGIDVQVPTMTFVRPPKLRYVARDEWTAVELPYAGGELSMWILVPANSRKAPRLTPSTLASLGDATSGHVDLRLSKWDFGSDFELLAPLKRLGLHDLGNLPAFDAIVDQAIHRANVTVDERGTEAATVTGISMIVSAPPPPELTLKADRPFTFAIVHKPTGAPMFLGAVADPTAS